MNIREFLAAIAIAKEMNTDEPSFEYKIEDYFDEVIGVSMTPTITSVYLGEFRADGITFELTTVRLETKEVKDVAEKIGYLDYF